MTDQFQPQRPYRLPVRPLTRGDAPVDPDTLPVVRPARPVWWWWAGGGAAALVLLAVAALLLVFLVRMGSTFGKRLAGARAATSNSRGLACYHRKEYDQAVAEFDRAIELDPAFAPAYSNRGLVQMARGDYARHRGLRRGHPAQPETGHGLQ
jgi:tetratricopeptide (TPR) repeat protein